MEKFDFNLKFREIIGFFVREYDYIWHMSYFIYVNI